MKTLQILLLTNGRVERYYDCISKDWIDAMVVSLHKFKSVKNGCANHSGISLQNVKGKMFRDDNSIKSITHGKVKIEQGGLIEGYGCVKKNFTM